MVIICLLVRRKTSPNLSHCNSLGNLDFSMTPSCQIGISIYRQPLEWIKRSIYSALDQSRFCNSFCTVRLDGPDSCSTETQNWLFWRTTDQPRLNLLIGSTQLGTFGSYREIFKTSKSAYLCQLDADDWLQSGIVSQCIKVLEIQQDAPFVYTNHKVVNAVDQEIRLGGRSKQRFDHLEQLVQFNTFHLRLLRRSSYEEVGGYNSDLKYTGDYDISLKLAELGLPIHLDEIGYFYREHPSGTSSIYKTMLQSEAFMVAEKALKRRGQQHFYELSIEQKSGAGQVVLKSRKGPILIAGMHRSGTSAVSRMLKACGFDLGADLLGADLFNPHGYHEDVHALTLNRAMLKELGLHPDWGFGGVANQQLTIKTSADFRSKLKYFLDLRNQNIQYWGWKDPRNTLLLDIWNDIVPCMRVIAIFREPWDVVASLGRRYKFFRDNPTLAVDTWTLFNHKLLDHVTMFNEKCVVINASRAIHSPKDAVYVIQQKLRLLGFNVDANIADTVDSGIYGQKEVNTRLSASWDIRYPEAMRIYDQLESFAEL